ncbi:cyclin-like protein [Mollisia scopiformis]|uniref:RNA polymerase II holoenzyme cyclin-like subunit n=1 Tax=Mollisia scopiformis TaxID=149040 RepID=A0A194XKX0_MOLSC|nr:cyclin-like protein [Mollisia scopiformis]KUJ20880.1 cyclin-like protein [Mollisia scopiformis]
MSEDERYRTSTQYRLWSYTPQALLALRTTTNQIAADRVREAVRRIREARNISSADTSEAENGRSASAAIPEGEVDCLTVEEELKLVAFYSRQTLQLGDHLKVPTDVKATAIQYMKRFYITNSLMTYHPTDILKTALFFATKTENHYFRLTKFADAIGKTKPEDVLASEFLLTQGLRFTFDVRHPFRALEGAIMELEAFAKGGVPPLPGALIVEGTLADMEKRVKIAHGKAREYLKISAALTDVYFHYTPSQIMMAALMIADHELVQWYIGVKFPAADGVMLSKVLEVIEKCADMLKTVAPNSEPSAAEKKELSALAKKLKKCRNPEKMDLVALQRAKREGDGEDEEKIVKKRKLERESSAREADDLFGPPIKKE